jgi:single-strand DNA-binding protein
MAYELQGRLFEIFDTQQITDTFKKREFVVETTSGMYNEYIKMQAVQDKCDFL